MKFNWREGNQLRLLENGEEFFPRVFAAIRAARTEVLLETFILFEDKVGKDLHAELIAAAARGVRVHLTVDDYGSPDLSPAFIMALTGAGVHLHIFDPRPRFMGIRTNLLHRLHRKIVVIDGTRAFVGGINFSADHLDDFGPLSKQDYSVEVEGPVVEDIHRFALAALEDPEPSGRWWLARPRWPVKRQTNLSKGRPRVLFVTRDNEAHKNDIEHHYLEAIRSARSRLLIANAYFFPGYRLLRELSNAAKRGVKVRLIIQGKADVKLARFGPRMLYDYLLGAGVQIYEYSRRPMHGKVALADDEWATIGSSNLDPLSLSVNLEANLVIRDPAFNHQLHDRLEALITDHCRSVSHDGAVRGHFWRAPLVFLIFHFLRHFPAISSWLPARRPQLALIEPPSTPPVSATLSKAQHKVLRAPPRVATDKPNHPVWRLTKKALTGAFFILVAVLLVSMARHVEWREVFATVRATRMNTLLLAGAVAFTSYLVYASFDVLGKIYTRHQLPVSQILLVTFVCYAFTLNLSTWLGSIALRYRLYSRLGLPKGVIARVFTFSIMTNWLGYMALAGGLLATGAGQWPSDWPVSKGMLRPLGAVVAAVPSAYLVLCAVSKRRSFSVRGHEIELPSLRLALGQLVLGACNWMLMALIIYVLLQQRVAYVAVLSALLASAIAGVMAHIPAGLGVAEAVFVALLRDQVSKAAILAALIGYRTVYYLLPLLIATVLYLLLEAGAKKLRRKNRDTHPADPASPGLGLLDAPRH